MNLRGEQRQEFKQRVRKLAFKRCCGKGGIPKCETCGIFLQSGNIFYEHVTPDGLGGEPTLENCKVHCKTCADVKTFTEDNPRMAKADRVLKANYGLRPTRKKIQSAGFRKVPPQRSASRPIERK